MRFKTKVIMTDICIALLNVIGVIISSVGVVALKEWIAKRKCQTHTNLHINKTECWMQLDKITANIRETLDAKGIYIAYFHNGGKFCNGLNMDKFTVIAEDYDITIKESYKRYYANVLTSLIPYTILRLYRDGKYILRMSNVTKYHSTTYVNDLKNRGINTTISILIRDLTTDIPIGFLSVEFAEDFEPTQDHMTTLWKNHNRISRNMTMILDTTNDNVKN